MIWIRITDPRSLGSWGIKVADESVTWADSPGSLMYHDPSDLGSLILIQITPASRNAPLHFHLRGLEIQWKCALNQPVTCDQWMHIIAALKTGTQIGKTKNLIGCQIHKPASIFDKNLKPNAKKGKIRTLQWTPKPKNRDLSPQKPKIWSKK